MDGVNYIISKTRAAGNRVSWREEKKKGIEGDKMDLTFTLNK